MKEQRNSSETRNDLKPSTINATTVKRIIDREDDKNSLVVKTGVVKGKFKSKRLSDSARNFEELEVQIGF